MRHSGPRLVYLALHRKGGGQVSVRKEGDKTSVDGFVVILDSSVEAPEAELREASEPMPKADLRIERTQSHRLPYVGYHLFIPRKVGFDDSSCCHTEAPNLD